jgi:hypothetical protein
MYSSAGAAFCALLEEIVYARHVEDIEFIGGRIHFGFERLDMSSSISLKLERLKAKGLMGCPFDPAQSKRSPLYMSPVLIVR